MDAPPVVGGRTLSDGLLRPAGQISANGPLASKSYSGLHVVFFVSCAYFDRGVVGDTSIQTLARTAPISSHDPSIVHRLCSPGCNMKLQAPFSLVTTLDDMLSTGAVVAPPSSHINRPKIRTYRLVR